MADESKRVAVVEDWDDFLNVFNAEIAGFEARAKYAAIDYAENNKPEDRQAYQRANQAAETITRLRGEVTRRVRMLLPGEVDRLQNKG